MNRRAGHSDVRETISVLGARQPVGQHSPASDRNQDFVSPELFLSRKRDCKSIHPRPGRGQVEEDGFLAARCHLLLLPPSHLIII